MGDESKFWLGTWGILGTVFLGSTVLIGGCIYKNNELSSKVVNDAIQKGSDPITAKCAMLIGSNNISSGEVSICLSAAKK